MNKFPGKRLARLEDYDYFQESSGSGRPEP